MSDGLQAIRSSGSVAANYIEANESLGSKDLLCRVKICRKESKESRLWLMLFDVESNLSLDSERQGLVREAFELMNIFGAILRKLKK